MDEDGNDDFTLIYSDDDSSKIVGISDGLIWENTLFWHWKGPCAHEYEDPYEPYDPSDEKSPHIFDYWLAQEIEKFLEDAEKDKKKEKDDKKRDKKSKDKKSKDKKSKDKDKDAGDGSEEGSDSGDEESDGDTPSIENPDIMLGWSPEGNLSNPNRTSWREHQ